MLRFILSILLISLLVACGSDSSKDEKKDAVTEVSALIGEDPDAVLEVKNRDDGYFVSKANFQNNTINNDAQSLAPYIDKPLYVDEVFEGIIKSVTQIDENSSSVSLENANDISEVYERINLDFTLENIAQTLTRSLQNKSIGKYDYLNTNKLQASVYVKNTSKKRGVVKNELVMRIDIPKDYQVNISPRYKYRGLDCDIFDASCVAELSAKPKTEISLENSLTTNGLTFSTEGSYIEFGLGTNLKFEYDKNLLSQDYLAFELTQSMFYEANFVYTVKGELSKDWSSELELTDGFDLIIPHPYSTVAKVSVLIKPDIEIGASGTIKGEFIAKANNKRDGAATFSFDSDTTIFIANDNITTSAENAASSSVEFSIQADANAYISPLISLSPRIDFLNVNQPFSIGDVRSSVKINNAFEGKFETGFLVTQNSEEAAANLDASASFMITYEPIVDYKFDVKIGTYSFYLDKEYKTLYQGEKGIILDWNIELLNTPKILTQEKDGNTYASFDIDATSNKDKIKFYYNLKGKDITIDNVFSQTLWDGQAIQLDSKDSNKIVLKAVLLNSDISTGVWSFGSSYSLNATQTVSVQEPDEPSDTTDLYGSSMYWDEADKFCTAQGKRIPSMEEYQSLYNSGYNFKDSEYWTYESWWNTSPYEGYQSYIFRPASPDNTALVHYHDRHKVAVVCL